MTGLGNRSKHDGNTVSGPVADAEAAAVQPMTLEALLPFVVQSLHSHKDKVLRLTISGSDQASHTS